MGVQDILSQIGVFITYLLNLPLQVIVALVQNPLWLAEIVLIAGGIVWLKWRRRKPRSVFHRLAKKFPSVMDSETLLKAEHEAFESLKPFALDGLRVDVISQSRIEQLERIRSDLRYIERELSGNRFGKNPELRAIWEHTLRKAAAQIAEDYRFDNADEVIAKLRQQMEILGQPDEPNTTG